MKRCGRKTSTKFVIRSVTTVFVVCHFEVVEFTVTKLMKSLKEWELLVQLNLNIDVYNVRHRIKWFSETLPQLFVTSILFLAGIT